MGQKCFAVIPARGGSKRIPKKNIRDFCGRPLIAYSIEAARNAKIFDEVFVTTDDHEIKEIAESYGALVPFIRSDKLSHDTCPTAPVIADFISRVGLSHNEVVCCIYPTAPLIESEKLIEGFQLLKSTPSVDFVCAVTDYPYPIQRALYKDNSGLLNMELTKFLHTRSQDLKTAFHDAGQFYFAFVDKWTAGKPMLMNTLGVFLDRWKVQDLDTLHDWERLTVLYALLHKTNISGTLTTF